MSDKMRIEIAYIEDAKALTEVQVRTFDDDSGRFAGQEKGGPPGYDSVEWQINIMQHSKYYKIMYYTRIIGGIILFDMGDGVFNLGRIYIDPEYQNMGVGTNAIKFIEMAFPQARKWTLETPGFAVRNHHFYEKMGYIKVGESRAEPDGFHEYHYEKVL